MLRFAAVMPQTMHKPIILPDSAGAAAYDRECRRCPRLARHLAAVRAEHPGYHCRPVPPFGDAAARLVVVGLAPGKHGANATGRPFTGDHAGILLYATLHRYGFASQPEGAAAGDGMRLRDCRITNAVKCLPPGNKPQPAEVHTCNAFLAAELTRLPRHGALLALGRVAHTAVLRALQLPAARYPFTHGARHDVGSGRMLIDSYHCSRYNTNTRRLTAEMFDQVVGTAAAHLAAADITDGPDADPSA